MRHADLVVLGLIARAPRHGYEIRRELERMRIRQWARISPATVYNALARLATIGDLTASTQQPGARPERTVYRLTEQGRRRLGVLVRDALKSSAPVYSDRVVGTVIALQCLPGREAARAIATGLKHCQAAAGRFDDAASEAQGPGQAVIGFGRDVLDAEKALLEWAHLQLKK